MCVRVSICVRIQTFESLVPIQLMKVCFPLEFNTPVCGSGNVFLLKK